MSGSQKGACIEPENRFVACITFMPLKESFMIRLTELMAIKAVIFHGLSVKSDKFMQQWPATTVNFKLL